MSLAFARYVQVWEDINSQKENKKYDFDLYLLCQPLIITLRIFEISHFPSFFLNPKLQQQQTQKRISIPEMQLNPIKSPSKPPVLAT